MAAAAHRTRGENRAVAARRIREEDRAVAEDRDAVVRARVVAGDDAAEVHARAAELVVRRRAAYNVKIYHPIKSKVI